MNRTRHTATPDELDAVILAAMRAARGELVPWNVLRKQLPAAPFWRKVEALVRLHEAGKVCAFKVDGRTYVDLPLSDNRFAVVA